MVLGPFAKTKGPWLPGQNPALVINIPNKENVYGKSNTEWQIDHAGYK